MKTELLKQLEDLLNHEQLLNFSDEFKTITDQYYNLIKSDDRQFEISKLEQIEAGEKPENIVKITDPSIEEFKGLINTFKERRKSEIEAIKESEESNYKIKNNLLTDLKTLIENEENIGKAISTIKEIQNNWKNTGPIPRAKRQDIQKEFSILMDDFQYNIKIYKEIKEHDLVKNGKLKHTIVDQLKSLATENNIKVLEQKLHKLQDEWNEIGGTTAEDWEVLKDAFWTTVNDLYKKVRDFYDTRKENQKENLLKKLALIDQVDKVISFECSNQSDWQKSTNKILEIQAEWKTVGYAPKKENEIVWKGFRAKCDIFFDAKKEFFKDINLGFDKVKAKKEELIAKVVAVKNSKDWNDITKIIVNLQRDWKKLGSAGQRNENQLWKKFREPIDFFFKKKEEFYDELDKENAGNLDLKTALITTINDYSVSKDIEKTITDLKAFSKSFNDIGNVPFKQKDEIYSAYKKAINEKYEAIDLDAVEKEKILYSIKVESIYNSPNLDRELEKENLSIRKSIDEMTKEKLQVENNLSFFANSDDNNPLLKNVKLRISKIENSIEQLKAKLHLLNNFDQESE